MRAVRIPERSASPYPRLLMCRMSRTCLSRSTKAPAIRAVSSLLPSSTTTTSYSFAQRSAAAQALRIASATLSASSKHGSTTVRPGRRSCRGPPTSPAGVSRTVGMVLIWSVTARSSQSDGG